MPSHLHPRAAQKVGCPHSKPQSTDGWWRSPRRGQGVSITFSSPKEIPVGKAARLVELDHVIFRKPPVRVAIRAPTSGRVLTHHLAPGEWASFGQPILTLVEDDDVWCSRVSGPRISSGYALGNPRLS